MDLEVEPMIRSTLKVVIEHRTKAANKMRTPMTRYHVPVPLMCGLTSRSYSRWVPKVRRSGMALSASIAKSSILVDLQLALATSVVTGINVLLGERKLGALVSLRSLLILMVLCVIGITVLCVLVLNFVDCLLG